MGRSGSSISSNEGDVGTGVLVVLITLVGWSSIPLFLRHFAESIDVWTSNGWRYGFSALLWLPVLLFGWRRQNLPAGLWKRALVPALVNSVGQTTFAAAHYQIDPGLLTFGLRLQIAFVVIGAALLFPVERAIIRSKWFLWGLMLVMAGTVGTVAFGEGLGESSTALGVSLAVASGLLFACYALSVRWFMEGVRPFVAFAMISQYTALAMVGLMLVLGERYGAMALALDGGQFGLLLLSAIIGIALGHVFYYTAIAHLGVAVSSGVIQLQPVAVAIASMAIFDEILTPAQWGSGVAAIAGAALVLWAQHRLSRARVAGRPHADVEEFESLPPDHVAAASSAEFARHDEDEGTGRQPSVEPGRTNPPG